MKNMTIFLGLGLLLLAIFFACKGNKKMPENNSKLVEMQTSGCRGFCPVYRLTFLNNGTAEFDGQHHTAETGLHNFKISKEELTELQRLVAAANLRQHPDRFESTVVDAPGVTLTVFDGPQPKKVYGSFERPKPLIELESYMMSLAEKKGLHVRRGVDPNEPAPGTRSEVLVQLKSDLNAGNWIMQFEELRLRLVRRIPPNNTWVVAFDRALIEEKDLIDLLKSSEGVLNAQPNHRMQERN